MSSELLRQPQKTSREEESSDSSFFVPDDIPEDYTYVKISLSNVPKAADLARRLGNEYGQGLIQRANLLPGFVIAFIPKEPIDTGLELE